MQWRRRAMEMHAFACRQDRNERPESGLNITRLQAAFATMNMGTNMMKKVFLGCMSAVLIAGCAMNSGTGSTGQPRTYDAEPAAGAMSSGASTAPAATQATPQAGNPALDSNVRGNPSSSSTSDAETSRTWTGVGSTGGATGTGTSSGTTDTPPAGASQDTDAGSK